MFPHDGLVLGGAGGLCVQREEVEHYIPAVFTLMADRCMPVSTCNTHEGWVDASIGRPSLPDQLKTKDFNQKGSSAHLAHTNLLRF